jgi:hypothetical protein
MDSSIPPLTITNRDVQHWLENSTPQETNDMWSICCNWRNQHQHPGSEFSTPTSKVLKVEKWIELLRKRALTHRNFALIKAVTSVLNATNRRYDQATRPEGESTSFSKESEKGGALNYDGILKPRIASPSDDISDLDLNVPESDDDSECIFPLSPCAHDDDSNSKSVSTLPTHDTNMPEEDLGDRITSAKDIQPAFTGTGFSNNSLKIAGNDCQHWPKRFPRRDQASDQEREMGLETIREESQEQ